MVKDINEKTVARWSLISNVPTEITAVELTTWYYWRWSIECYFKLLKQAGHDISVMASDYPRSDFKAFADQLMACVLTWRVQRCTDEQNQKVRAIPD